MPTQIVVVAGPDRGKTFPITPGVPLVVGRGQTSGTHLQDPRISRAHCELVWQGASLFLQDSGSVGGTFVNGEKVGRRELKSGDVIRVGDSELRFEADVAEDATLPPPDVVPAAPVTRAAPPPKPTQATRAPAPAAPPPPPAPAAAPAPVFARKAGQRAIPPALKPLYGLEGKAFGRYQLQKVIGAGTIGVVFQARDTGDGKSVALKVLKADFAKDEDAMQRFIRGIMASRTLAHPNLVAIHNAGRQGPHCWIALEYIEGESLAQKIQNAGGKMDWKFALRVMTHVTRGLEVAHQHQIIHRNVMPPNILIRKSDQAALLGDVLLAKALDGTQQQEITEAGELVGSIFYMSPERTQAQGQEDARSDLYMLGATGYQMIAGRLPFAGMNLIEVVGKIRQTAPEKPSKFQPGLPAAFETLVLKLLAKQPAQRYQTATDLLADLNCIGHTEKVSL